MKNYWISWPDYLHKKDHRSVKTKRNTLTLSTSGSPSFSRRHVIEPAMVTSSGRWTPSLFSSSSSAAASAAVASTVIAFLLLTSIHETTCSPARFQHRNISTQVDHHDLQAPPSFHSSPANQSLLLAPLHRMVRRGSGSSGTGSSNTPKIACYSCTYIFEEDYTSGVECNDPFNSANIPEVMCPGFCHKMKKKLHQGGLMLVRGCQQTCQEKVDEHGYRHCCKSKLCNRSVSLNSANNAIKLICSTVLCLFLAVRLNSFG